MRMQRLASLVVGTTLVLGASSAGAQQPAPAAAPPPPPPYGAPITLEQAKKVMVGAESEAKKNNWNMVIVILDSGGNIVMLQRMDGAQLGSIDVAKEKAYSAVAFRRPTKAFDDALAQGGANLRILRLPGASPVAGRGRHSRRGRRQGHRLRGRLGRHLGPGCSGRSGRNR